MQLWPEAPAAQDAGFLGTGQGLCLQESCLEPCSIQPRRTAQRGKETPTEKVSRNNC